MSAYPMIITLDYRWLGMSESEFLGVLETESYGDEWLMENDEETAASDRFMGPGFLTLKYDGFPGHDSPEGRALFRVRVESDMALIFSDGFESILSFRAESIKEYDADESAAIAALLDANNGPMRAKVK